MKLSPNRHYLVTDDNQPFFYLADTAWMLFYRPTLKDIAIYLDDRKSKGFTVIMPLLLREYGLTDLVNCEGARPFIENDPTRPNETFFRRVDFIMKMLAERGFTIALLPTWGVYVGALWVGESEPPNFNPGKRGPEIFDERTAYIYGEYLGRRYRDFPVIWVLGGDRNPVNDTYRRRWESLAAGLNVGDGGKHLMTYHPIAVNSSSQWFHESDWLDFNMIQTSTRWDLDNAALVLADYNCAPTKPVLDGETRYEDSYENFSDKRGAWGRRITAHQVRKSAYNAMFSGALGHTYGCRDVWYFYEPSDQPPPKDLKTHWKTAKDFDGAFQMGILRDLLTRYPFHKLIPAQNHEIVVHGYGADGTFTPAARADDSSFALVYVPEYMPVWVDTACLGGEFVRVSWFDPRTGQTMLVGQYPAQGVERFVPPFATEPDFILILERVA